MIYSVYTGAELHIILPLKKKKSLLVSNMNIVILLQFSVLLDYLYSELQF